MKTAITSVRLRLSQATRILLCAVASGLFAPVLASSQTTLTRVIEASTDASGNHYVGNVWNTLGGDIVVNTFVTSGPGLANPFLNGPTDAQAAIFLPLNVGVNRFTFFSPGGNPQPFHGMNLYFNGSSSPGISVFAPTQTTLGPAPTFSANGGQTYSPNWPTLAPGANTLSFLDGNRQITLTEYSWTAPSVYNVDRVTAASGNYGSVGPDGLADWVGQITLEVTIVPEPTSFSLSLLGITGVLMFRRRNSGLAARNR